MCSENQVATLQKALEQVRLDSREIEEELEAELAARTKLCDELQSQLNLNRSKTETFESDLQKSRESLQTLESLLEDFREEARIKEASIAKLEEENQKLLEKLALSEADKAHQSVLEDALERESREKLDALEEIQNYKRKIASAL